MRHKAWRKFIGFPCFSDAATSNQWWAPNCLWSCQWGECGAVWSCQWGEWGTNWGAATSFSAPTPCFAEVRQLAASMRESWQEVFNKYERSSRQGPPFHTEGQSWGSDILEILWLGVLWAITTILGGISGRLRRKKAEWESWGTEDPRSERREVVLTEAFRNSPWGGDPQGSMEGGV